MRAAVRRVTVRVMARREGKAGVAKPPRPEMGASGAPWAADPGLESFEEDRAAREAGQRRALKKRGVLLATVGLLLALAVAAVLRYAGVVDFDPLAWVAALLLTLAVQVLFWTMAHTGWDERLAWDPHFLYLPMLTAAGLLNLYIFIVPEARVLILMGWFVALLFMAGLAGLTEVVLLSGVMASGYLAAVSLRAAEGFPVTVGFEVTVALVFFAICGYAGLVFRRLRAERRKMNELRRELSALAIQDSLTRLPNRRHFEALLREELVRVRRYGEPCCVAMLDVDYFKIYNDTLGHLAGDEVLRQLGRLLEANVRDSDIAARYGGEEFALILVRTSLPKAEEVVERLRRIVQEHPFEREDLLPGGALTISAGIAVCDAAAGEEDVVRRADQALYAAKNAGRNRVVRAE